MDNQSILNKQANHPSSLFDTLARHPYFCVIAACFLLLPFGLAEQSNLSISSVIYAGTVLAVICVAVVACSRLGKTLMQNLAIVGIALLYILGSAVVVSITGFSTFWIYLLTIIGLCVIAVALKLTNMLSTRAFVALMIVAGIALRLIYILYTDSSSRQHDVGWFNWSWGHANYIEYWYNNGLTLPDFDVRIIWQYYHPPLHHWLMALLLRGLTTIGIDYSTACQAIQILPMLYSSLIMVVSYKIFRQIKLSGTPLIVAMALICFHPTFVIMAGSFNNDILSILFIMLSILWAFKWYNNRTFKNIIVLALCIGLGMMTKLSVWMVAPAVAFLFIYALCKNLKDWTKYILQFVVFGVICVPLALWWQVRNFLTFGVPLTYVPNLGIDSNQYIGNMSILQRLFDFSKLSNPFEAFIEQGATYNEYNPTLGLFKTAVFDEGNNGINSVTFPQIEVTGAILLWVSIILFLLCFVAFIYVMASKKSELPFTTRVFYVILFAVFLGSYYIFCFQYPHTCTMNIRYCVPLIPMCAMGLGKMLQIIGNKPIHKAIRYCSYALTVAFAVMTSVVFVQIGI